MTWLLICLGAAVGAPARYLTDRIIQTRHDSLFPWGTFAVNLVGSLILGVLLGAGSRGEVPAAVLAALGTGFCGALTTFSTFGYETIRLTEDGARLIALINIAGSIAAGFAAAALGYAAGRGL